jgi:hypothetical protein
VRLWLLNHHAHSLDDQAVTVPDELKRTSVASYMPYRNHEMCQPSSPPSQDPEGGSSGNRSTNLNVLSPPSKADTKPAIPLEFKV